MIVEELCLSSNVAVSLFYGEVKFHKFKRMDEVIIRNEGTPILLKEPVNCIM